MEMYRCDLLLHDYLFFATTERGKVAETGPFIHNYALTYALGWASSSWRNVVQKPGYREELARVGKRYVTPAQVLRGSYVVSQYNTMSENYGIGQKEQSIGYPDWGFIKCFRPGALFRCYVISAEAIHLPRYLRLGKFMAKTEVKSIQAQRVQRADEMATVPNTMQKHAQYPFLSWNDLAVRPRIFDIIVNALPGHIIANPVFDENVGSSLIADFAGDDLPIQVPLRMGYYGENLCESW